MEKETEKKKDKKGEGEGDGNGRSYIHVAVGPPSVRGCHRQRCLLARSFVRSPDPGAGNVPCLRIVPPLPPLPSHQHLWSERHRAWHTHIPTYVQTPAPNK